ncbi:aminoglycoside phosphotransferase family protein [Actinopolymorpha sp. B11F2]|uniref:phosphotransferase family protein n=1 Tax=Actinopolymorpha sp. B11F2 TaxID=3160862 RepID=UPI0032E3D420
MGDKGVAARAVDVSVDELVGAALSALERERPDIAVAPVRLVYTGFSSHVLTTGSGFVVRVARTPEAEVGHRRETRLLPVVASVVSVAVPVPVWRLEPGPRSRFGAMAYRRIEGAALPRDGDHSRELVVQLAEFLLRLHRTREDSLTSAVASLAGWKHGAIATASRAVDHLAGELPAAMHRRLVAWREAFVRHLDGMPDERAGLAHGDFWHDNVMTRGDQLAGVLDWEAAALADPAVDLAPVWDIDENLGARLLDSYQQQAGPDPALPHRIRLFRIARNIGGITWSLDNNDPEEYDDSLTKVHDVLHLI